jgi:hypothetical protein
MTNTRAVRYRRLALAETDPAAAAILQILADEAERGVLCVSEKSVRSSHPPTTKPVTVDH